MRQYNPEVDKFLDAAVEACCIMDFRTFQETVSWFSYDPLIAKAWTRRIMKMIDDCQRDNLAPGEIAGLFPSTSQLRCMMIFDLWMAKYTDISRQEREKVFDFYSSLLKTSCREDPYARTKNIIHPPREIQKFLSELKLATPEIAKILGRLVNACYHLGHALYSDLNPATVYENYGPYDVSDKYGQKHILAIKEFKNLRPLELWPESAVLPCESIQIVDVYKDVKMTVDTASHAVYKGDLIKGLKYFSLKIDEKDCPVVKLDKISQAVEKIAVLVFQKFQALEFEAKKEKYYFLKAYVYKKIYERLRQDWRPAEEVLKEARHKKLYRITWPQNKEKQKTLIRKTLDPRIDFKI